MTSRPKGPMGTADDYASKIVRARAGYRCEWFDADGTPCSTTTILQCSHIIPRGFSATRCDLDNLQALCGTHHALIEQFADERMAWFARSIGLDTYERLKAQAQAYTRTTKKINWKETSAELRRVWKEMEAAA